MLAQLPGLGPVGQAVDRLPAVCSGIFFWQSCPGPNFGCLLVQAAEQ